MNGSLNESAQDKEKRVSERLFILEIRKWKRRDTERKKRKEREKERLREREKRRRKREKGRKLHN